MKEIMSYIIMCYTCYSSFFLFFTFLLLPFATNRNKRKKALQIQLLSIVDSRNTYFLEFTAYQLS
jgi:hypothetical protein